MKAAIICQNSKSSKWTFEEMKKHFDEVDKIYLKKIEVILGAENEILYKGKPLDQYDCIYAKGSFRFAELLKSITALIPERTYLPIASDAYVVAHDKLLTQAVLAQAGLPMPKTYLSPTIDFAKILLKNIPYPIVMKFPKGTQGKGVMFADSYSSAISILDAMTALNQPIIIQEYIETGGADVRAFVIGDKVVAAMKRTSQGEDKRSNIHAGGTGEIYELSDEQRKIAVKAAQMTGIGICGVDLLITGTKTVVIEVNLSPGLQGITKATKTNIAEKIAKYLYEESKKHKDKMDKIGEKKILHEEGLIDKNGMKHIITNIDFRGNRILMPEIVSKITGFSEDKEVTIDAKKGYMTMKD